MIASDSENTRRIRAAVRVLVSQGVWAAVALDVLVLVVSQSPAVVIPVLLALFYVAAGNWNALAHGRESVSFAGAVRSAKPVFGKWLWLMTKGGGFAGLFLLIGFSVAEQLTGAEIETLVKQSAILLTWAFAVAGFILVYWMPVVFFKQQFALLPSLGLAVRVAWRRLPQSAYLAVLTLSPVVAFSLLGPDAPGWSLAIMSVVGSLMSWTAYTYCVESLQVEDNTALP